MSHIWSRPLSRIMIILSCLLLVASIRPAQAAPHANGVIAYVVTQNGREDQIRLVNPDGSNNRLLWTTGDLGSATSLHYVSDLAWKPGGTELALTSKHQEACSFYASDIYAIRSDGANFRRITAPPACGVNLGYPTGTVTVTYFNNTTYSGPFNFYFEGAPQPQSYALAPGASLAVTFYNVIDYGSQTQWAVAVYGDYRYHSVSGNADVQPGKVVSASVNMVFGYADWARHNPTWSPDGAQIAYLFGDDANPFGIPAANTAPGQVGAHLLASSTSGLLPFSAKFLAWEPTPATANRLLYEGYENGDNIYLATAGQAEPGQIVLKDSDLGGFGFKGLAWLPDGSGFIYSMVEGYGDYANIFRYSFSNGQSTRLTNFTSGFTRRLAVSADGSAFVYERQTTGDAWNENPATDLYLMNMNGGTPVLLVAGGRSPAWGIAAAPPMVPSAWIYLPILRK